jgi:hypothetical protein
MPKPKLTRENCARIREIYRDLGRNRSMADVAAMFGVTVPIIHAVLHNEYKPLEEYLEEQFIVCTGCGHKLHPSLAVFADHAHGCSEKSYHCKPCYSLCSQGADMGPGRTYSVVVRDPHTWNQVTGIRDILRECGHHHRTVSMAQACGKRLLKAHCEHGRPVGMRCKLCRGPARKMVWESAWESQELEDSKGHKVQVIREKWYLLTMDSLTGEFDNYRDARWNAICRVSPTEKPRVERTGKEFYSVNGCYYICTLEGGKRQGFEMDRIIEKEKRING